MTIVEILISYPQLINIESGLIMTGTTGIMLTSDLLTKISRIKINNIMQRNAKVKCRKPDGLFPSENYLLKRIEL